LAGTGYSGLEPDQFNIRNIFDRLKKMRDPWKDGNNTRRNCHVGWIPMSLVDYSKKRNFKVTPEPAGFVRIGNIWRRSSSGVLETPSH
jgi:hypothetical protein